MEESQSYHINVLERRAAKVSLQAFLKNSQNFHMHIRIANQTTMAQNNKIEGSKSLPLLNDIFDFHKW